MAVYSVAERRNKALNLLKENGQVSVTELSELLDVSEVTIRKDLQYLERRNLLIRTHGGAMQNNYLVQDQHFEVKGKKYADEKRRIGEAAASLVQDGDTIIMDAGTTMIQLARCLHNKRNLTILSSAINVAMELMHIPDVQLVMLGGVIRSTSAAVVGPFAETMVNEHYCSKLFLAGDGLDPDFGVTTTNGLEAHLNKMMIASAQETILIMDSSKFGRRGLSRICGLDKINLIITDSGISDHMKKVFEERDVPLMIV
ncbi:MAG: DeoR/GlpR family DNA-binding transcription regulator [Balneolales bacterium]|nr:DeoR/GlpR family DNA-binding transcription regulator [Balneolales bacterium]